MLGAAATLAAAGVFGPAALLGGEEPDIVVGRPSTTVREELPGPTIAVPAETTVLRPPDPHPAPAFASGAPVRVATRRWPDGTPYGNAIAFTSDVPVPDGLLFVLVAGSDARPGEALDRARADSVHLLALNPRSGTGTIVGIPRDTWVEIPGRGHGKINSALSLGGMDLLARTVRQLTGLPVDYWALTGFTGLEAMVDAVGGVTTHVGRRMSDRASGAFFEPGWHRMSGRDALAFSRNRNDPPTGDFERSQNHGVLLQSALTKMRVEIGDMAGIRRWGELLVRHARLDIGIGTVVRLGAVARRIDARSVTNVVTPGRVGSAQGQSVVLLTADAASLFTDLRDDATVGRAPAPTTTTPPSTSTTTTTTTTTTVPATTKT